MKFETDATWIKANVIGIMASIATISIEQADLYLAVVLKIVTIFSLIAGASISIVKLIKYFKNGSI